MIADVFVFAFVLLFVWFGYRSGLIRTVFGFLSYFISIGISVLIYPYVSKALSENHKVLDYIGKIADKIQIGETEGAGFFEKFFLTSVNDAASSAVSSFLVNILAFLLVLVISRILLGVISRCLNVVAKLPVISSVNRIGGAVFGGLKSILILYIIFAVLIFIPSAANDKIVDNINESHIANKFYTENIIVDILGKDVLKFGK